MSPSRSAARMTAVSLTRVPPHAFAVEAVRHDFPALKATMRGKRLVYLDNAATTQQPAQVIEAQADYYASGAANVHRGAYTLSERATERFEGARERVRRFLNARLSAEVVFVRGTTEGVNLVASGFARRLRPGDEILISEVEHHSNIVPWQLAAQASGARLVVAPVDDTGALRLEAFEMLLGERTRLVALAHVSNALGTVMPVRRVVDLAHARGVPVLVDGAQAVAHFDVDVQELGCDFYAFSGHKMYAPTGIGALYGRRELLETLPPYQGGGDMVRSVRFEETLYAPLPHRLEAGTPNVGGAIGLAAAIDYLSALDREVVRAHEHSLLEEATHALSALPGVRIIGEAPEKAAVLSFVVDGVHPHDLATIADREGVALRAGHHCAQPTMKRFGVPATARASFALYNTMAEVEALVAAVKKGQEMLR